MDERKRGAEALEVRHLIVFIALLTHFSPHSLLPRVFIFIISLTLPLSLLYTFTGHLKLLISSH